MTIHAGTAALETLSDLRAECRTEKHYVRAIWAMRDAVQASRDKPRRKQWARRYKAHRRLMRAHVSVVRGELTENVSVIGKDGK